MTATHDERVLAAQGVEVGVEVGEAAEAVLEVLTANGVEFLFVMPGDAFPILEAAAKYDALGKAAPKVVTCLHEVTALSAAHGHFMVSGRPQACLFHVDIGVQAAGGMLHNAQRARAGVVILTGKTPANVDPSVRGGRVIDVHWMQDRADLAGIVRDYVKWHFDLQRTDLLAHVLQRAFQIAASEPTGPVFVSIVRELLMEPMGTVELLPPSRFAAPRAPVPDRQSLEEVADLVAGAERPLAIAGYVGRTAAGFHALQEFAEAAAVPVAIRPDRANLSSDSPMHVGTEPAELLADADLVLLLDVDVPYMPLFGKPSPQARVVQIDVDPLKTDIPLWGFPVDLSLAGSTAAALPLLSTLIAERWSDEQRALADERRERVAGEHRRRRDALRAAAEANAAAVPMAPDFVSLCVAELVDDSTIVVDDSTTSRWVTAKYVPTRVPGSYFQPMGASMGWGSGAALGAKLAARDRTVVCLNAEGNFLHGAPEGALWSAAREDAPFLTVVYDNAQYAAIKLGLVSAYPDGFAARSGATALELPEAPDIAALARACGAHGERVEDPGELRQALQRGLAAVHDGQPAVVNVVVAGIR